MKETKNPRRKMSVGKAPPLLYKSVFPLRAGWFAQAVSLDMLYVVKRVGSLPAAFDRHVVVFVTAFLTRILARYLHLTGLGALGARTGSSRSPVLTPVMVLRLPPRLIQGFLKKGGEPIYFPIQLKIDRLLHDIYGHLSYNIFYQLEHFIKS